ncbi:MAG TPA: phosphatase PAP2 family protein [Candidatus Tumulicola sp.]|jgi:acid phosphatase (class A)
MPPSRRVDRRALQAALLAIAVAVGASLPAASAAKTVHTPYYVSSADVDLTTLLAPPPDPDSPLERYDEKKIAEILVSRTNADLARAAADAHRSVFVFADVLGPGFNAQRVPLTAALFDRLDSDTELLVDQAKAYFARPRPPGAKKTHASYPSGHAAFAACAAILLSQMVPEKRDVLFGRASLFAQSRLVAGVHYPSDVQAGWISGTLVAAALMQKPEFRSDFAAAKAETRGALGLQR